MLVDDCTCQWFENTWRTFDTVCFMLEGMTQDVCHKGGPGVCFIATYMIHTSSLHLSSAILSSPLWISAPAPLLGVAEEKRDKPTTSKVGQTWTAGFYQAPMLFPVPLSYAAGLPILFLLLAPGIGKKIYIYIYSIIRRWKLLYHLVCAVRYPKGGNTA